MSKPLPHRPNLDHLRRQAKTLLARIRAGDPDAVQLLTEHLPSAKGMTGKAAAAAGIRLADAQFTIARSTGFGSWPKLAQHVELLRSLEGTWTFESLEVGGKQVPASHTQHSRILIDGDRFRTESPEAIYEGVFNIDVEASPQHIDIEFTEGPEAGNWNHGIFRLDGDKLEICLDMTGEPRPREFGTETGRGHAYEVLIRQPGTSPKALKDTGAQTVSDRHSSEETPAGPSGCGCAASINRLVPYVHVADVEASLAFYTMLGFTPVKAMKDDDGKMFWVLARSAAAEIMLAQSSGPIDAEQQAVLFYMYGPDLSALRANLIERGLRDAGTYSGARSQDDTTRMVHEIAHPHHMKSGEMRIIDPDGYVILVGQLD